MLVSVGGLSSGFAPLCMCLLSAVGKEKKELAGMEAAIEALEAQRQEYQKKLEKGHEVGG